MTRNTRTVGSCFGLILAWPKLSLRKKTFAKSSQHHQKTGIQGRRQRGMWCPAPHLVFHPPVAAYIQYHILKMCPLCGFYPPLPRNPGDMPAGIFAGYLKKLCMILEHSSTSTCNIKNYFKVTENGNNAGMVACGT